MTWNESSVAGKQWEVSPWLLRARYCVGTLPHLPARPLTHYLEGSEEITLTRAAGARMKPLLASGEVDTALLPTNDLGCFGPRMSILPVASLSGDESSLYTRIFSQVDPADITVLWVDRNCGSVLTLVQVLWGYQYRSRISVIPFDPGSVQVPDDVDAVLIIGDSVVTDPPIGFDLQFDPVGMWHEMTGLPFVFNVWGTQRTGAECERLSRLLLEARQLGQRHIEQIAAEHANAYGWPLDLATRCLANEMQFGFTDTHRESLEEFLALAAQLELLPAPGRLQYHTV